MKKMPILGTLFVALAFFPSGQRAWCQQHPPPASAPSPSPPPPDTGPPSAAETKSTSERPAARVPGQAGTIELGGVLIDAKRREVSVPCVVNMQEGLLEYALVGDAGKRHESLLMTTVEPKNLQAALLLLGVRAGRSVEFQGDPRAPEGDPLEIWAEWKNGEEIRRARLESLILNEKTRQPMGDMNWVFTGSKVVGGVFLAQVERSIIAIFHDPTAMIDNPLPDGADDRVWFADSRATPPVGTAVTVVIRSVR